MKFSIILPCFNSKSYINKCVDSILSQSFSDYELIVIDDGSTDGTSQILDEYASTYPHIHVHHFSNAGVSIARKRGISLATGEYSIFVTLTTLLNLIIWRISMRVSLSTIILISFGVRSI